MESAPAPRRHTRVSRWKALGPVQRRRIVLGSLFALALAARDVVLLLVAASLFALSEVNTSRPSMAQAS